MTSVDLYCIFFIRERFLLVPGEWDCTQQNSFARFFPSHLNFSFCRKDILLGSLSEHSSIFQARNTTLYSYALPKGIPTITELISTPPAGVSLLSPNVKAALTICFLYLMRVNEVLSLKVCDVIYPDRVICPGSKGGCGYMLFLPDLSKQLSDYSISVMSTNLFSSTYSQCYRGCIKAGIHLHCTTKGNTPRTHLYRYIFANDQYNNITPTVMRDLLHHRSVNSQQYYLNKSEVSHGKT